MSDVTANDGNNDDDVELEEWLSGPSRRLLREACENDAADDAAGGER